MRHRSTRCALHALNLLCPHLTATAGRRCSSPCWAQCTSATLLIFCLHFPRFHFLPAESRRSICTSVCRAEVFIPELGAVYKCHPGFRLFGAQNPIQEGGGRKGLPRSFLNRFTRVHVELLTPADLRLIAGECNVIRQERKAVLAGGCWRLPANGSLLPCQHLKLQERIASRC